MGMRMCVCVIDLFSIQFIACLLRVLFFLLLPFFSEACFSFLATLAELVIVDVVVVVAI